MLTYADVPLGIPTAELAAWIEKAISTRDVYEFAWHHWPGHRLAHVGFPPVPPNDRPVKLGTLFWPKGASRWAVGHFLAAQRDLELIRQVVEPRGALLPAALVMAEERCDGLEVSRIETMLYMLPPRPLQQCPHVSGGDMLWLLTLVDERFFWWFRDTGSLRITETFQPRDTVATPNYIYSAGDDGRSKVRTATEVKTDTLPSPAVVGPQWRVEIDNPTDTEIVLLPTSGKIDYEATYIVRPRTFISVYSDGENMFTGWADVERQLGIRAGVTVVMDPVESAYLRPRDVLAVDHEPRLPILLDAVAAGCGHRIIRRLDGTVLARDPARGQRDVLDNLLGNGLATQPFNLLVDAAGNHERKRHAGGYFKFGADPFPKDLAAAVPASVKVVFPKSNGSGTHEILVSLDSLALPEFAGIKGHPGTRTFHDATQYDGTNGGYLSKLTCQVAIDYYRHLAMPPRLDAKWPGIVPWVPEPFHESVEWTYHKAEVSTRVQPGDRMDRYDDMSSLDRSRQARAGPWCVAIEITPRVEACVRDRTAERWCAAVEVMHDTELCLSMRAPEVNHQSGAPTHTGLPGDLYYDSFRGRLVARDPAGYWRYIGPCDELSSTVFVGTSTTGDTILFGGQYWVLLDGTGPYTVTLPFASQHEAVGFVAADTLSGVVTLQARTGEKIRGPQGGDTDTLKMVKNEVVVLRCYQTGSEQQWVVRSETRRTVSFHATRETSQAIPASTPTRVQYDVVQWDRASCYDSVTNYRHQPDAPGIYRYGAMIGLGNLDDNAVASLMLYKNGSLYKVLDRRKAAGVTPSLVLHGSALASMNGTSDYVEVYLEHDGTLGDANTSAAEAEMTFEGSRQSREED